MDSHRILTPQGVADGSRWLSGAIPPVGGNDGVLGEGSTLQAADGVPAGTPDGVQQAFLRGALTGGRPGPRGRNACREGFLRCFLNGIVWRGPVRLLLRL